MAGEPDAEQTATADRTLDLDRTALVSDDPVADREAQARPRAHRLGCEEGLEDVRQVLGADSAAVVFDLNEDGGLSVRAGCERRSAPRARRPGWR